MSTAYGMSASACSSQSSHRLSLPAPPRSRVHFVDRHRRAPRIALAARGHPCVVGPGEMRGVADDRCRRRPQLGAEAHRIGLQRQQRPVRADELVLVERAFADAGHEDLPDAGVDALAHRVPAAVPRVEIADDRDAPRIRRPHGEMHAGLDPRASSRARRGNRRAARACLRRSASRRAAPAPGRTHTRRRRSRWPCGSRRAADSGARRLARPSKKPAGCRISRCARIAPSRASAVTLSAPGTNARTTTSSPVPCIPSTANGSAWRPSTMASICAAERRAAGDARRSRQDRGRRRRARFR